RCGDKTIHARIGPFRSARRRSVRIRSNASAVFEVSMAKRRSSQEFKGESRKWAGQALDLGGIVVQPPRSRKLRCRAINALRPSKTFDVDVKIFALDPSARTV
ncbi:MAG: hypothetical protein KGJ51_11795, partial [Acidobacteriota bacterium]|nr:hypothetical protein [Acidobacteriota bacterium]